MLFNSPLSGERADRIITMLALDEHSKVLDIGCGEGEFLTRIYQFSHGHCFGIDINDRSLDRARDKAVRLKAGGKLKYTETDIVKAGLNKNSFDLAVCIGSTHAFGMGDAAYPHALKEMKDLVKPGGLILIGEGFWKREPDQEYLTFIGEPVGVYNTHEENISQAESFHLISLYAVESNIDEWDHFEWSSRMEAELGSNKEKLDHVRKWNLFYRQYGRTTMGFGFYLFRKEL